MTAKRTEAQEFANRFNVYVIADDLGRPIDRNEYGKALRWTFKNRKSANKAAAMSGGIVIAPKGDK